MIARLRSAATLVRWLGPWSDPARGPDACLDDATIAGDDEPIRVRVYAGARATFVIAPGFTEQGPDDPRLERLCRVLAAAGYRVVSPYIPDYQDLVCSARAVRAFACLVRAEAARSPGGRVRVFSVSVGSVLALHAAAELPELVEQLVVFGGYADVGSTLEYFMTGSFGSRSVTRDPANHAIVALNVMADLVPAIPEAARPTLARALQSYVARTCPPRGHEPPESCARIAAELRAMLPPVSQLDFDDGIGARDSSTPRMRAAFARMAARGTALEVRSVLPRVRCRVDIVHGVGDLIVPYEQARLLGERMVAADAHVHIIGSYAHTGFSTRRLGVLARDALALVAILRALT